MPKEARTIAKYNQSIIGTLPAAGASSRARGVFRYFYQNGHKCGVRSACNRVKKV
jgi:hypothetical protein